MNFIKLISQTSLDSISMFLLCNYLCNKTINKENKNIYWIISLTFIYIFARISIPAIDSGMSISIDFFNFDILPINTITGSILLFIFLMILNNTLLKMNEKEAFFSTIASIMIWIFIRLFTILPFLLLNIVNTTLYEYGYRVLTLIILYILLIILKFPLYKFRQYLIENTFITKLIILNSFIALVVLIWIFNFDVKVLITNITFVMFVFSILIIINIYSIVSQRNIINQHKRIEVMEQYLPVIDDLMSEVRSRQHEFNNKFFAIYSILETSDNLEEAKLKVNNYSKNVILNENIHELFICDNKIISGFLYSKIKLASFKKITLDINISTSLKNICTEEYEIVEILGILIDNAIEASNSLDTIIVSVKNSDNFIEINVSNPYHQLSNTEFMQMFEKGYSTKDATSKPRGYGLYNVKVITEKGKGKVIAKNVTINNTNYITIGVLIP